MFKRPVGGLLCPEDLKEIVDVQKTSKMCSVSRRPVGGLLCLEGLWRSTMSRRPLGDLPCLEELLEVFYA